ncbi:MAG TPA: GTPase ObgE, partial [Chthoniobacterales bacterium]|nr:GTPase ObgE [Chthoniobacterales bacterium]
MFVDRIKVFAQAGNGGRGCVSFRREKFVPRGGPDGGDGGRGGDVILRADVHTDNLSNLFYEPIIKAKSGAHGQGKKKHGRAAVSKVVKVPVGTVVYRADAPVPRQEETESRSAVAAVYDRRGSNDLETATDIPAVAGTEIDGGHRPPLQIADLTHDGEEFILCQGGAGGKGNVHFKSSRNRAPVQYTEGVEGEQDHFLFELRTMADAALVGYPNAGKSTLLGKISAAHPKVAPYPFTTLHPIVGVVDLEGDYRRASIADIPGLIEGAHRNVGLGHDFLRHITRCRILLFVLDIAGSEGRHPVEDLQNLRREIDLYDPRLSERPWYVIANKMDLPDASENLQALQQRFPDLEVLAISAAQSEGLAELRTALERWLFGETGRLDNESL